MASRILVVEDEVAIRDMLCFVLEQHGYECLEADTYQSKRTVIIQSDDEIIVLEVPITEDNLNSNIKNINNDEIVPEAIVPAAFVTEAIVPATIFSGSINETNNDNYILVVQVFSSKDNASRYINKSTENLNFKEAGGKFYVYAYSNSRRDEVVKFKRSYKNDSWIKNP